MKMKSLLAVISVFLITAVGCSPGGISQEKLPTDTTASAAVSDTQILTDSDQITDSVITSLETERLPEETTEDPWVTQNRVIPDVIPVFDPNSMEVFSAEEALKKIPFATTFEPKYRAIYYVAPTFLSDLVSRDEWSKWYSEVITPNIENNTEPQEMYTVSFIKYFKIPRDAFEKECEERRKTVEKYQNSSDYYNDEGAEIHNADIIYTFDNEIINNYYLREQVQTDSGDIK